MPADHGRDSAGLKRGQHPPALPDGAVALSRVSTLKRWLRFNAVGLLGLALQLALLGLLAHLGLHYLPATFLAVEAAVLHNFVWHLAWTWSDRPSGNLPVLIRRLVEFHLANGLISLTGNLLLMRLLRGELALPVVPANLLSVGLLSLLNFLAGHRWVFSARRGHVPGTAREP